jgi:hypothetical protein
MNTGLKLVREEIRLASRRLSDAIYQTSGRGWRLAIETTGDEQERRVVGVESSGGTMVMGDCMSDVNNEVTTGDARFIALVDPSVAFYFSDLLEKGADLATDSPLFPAVHTVALEINRKWVEAQRALEGENA